MVESRLFILSQSGDDQEWSPTLVPSPNYYLGRGKRALTRMECYAQTHAKQGIYFGLDGVDQLGRGFTFEKGIMKNRQM
jgi:hypothetical protein